MQPVSLAGVPDRPSLHDARQPGASGGCSAGIAYSGKEYRKIDFGHPSKNHYRRPASEPGQQCRMDHNGGTIRSPDRRPGEKIMRPQSASSCIGCSEHLASCSSESRTHSCAAQREGRADCKTGDLALTSSDVLFHNRRRSGRRTEPHGRICRFCATPAAERHMRMKSILVIRLGAMGDILHALPAVASLKKCFPANKLTWLVARRWMPLLAGNPFIDDLIPLERSGLSSVGNTWRRLRALEPDTAIDFQGLLQSALAGRVARPNEFLGFDKSVAREPLASLFYTCRVPVTGPHRIERNLQLVAAAGAAILSHDSWIPPGEPEGRLPAGPFVLTSPFAGWKSKEWPLERYETLGRKLAKDGLALVANVPEHRTAEIRKLAHVHVHTSGIPGLVDATRRATAVIGLDSGPLHLAAALRKPGVALFGPTDPACTGPFGGSMSVLRTALVETTYKRGREIHASMTEITVEQVSEALAFVLSAVPRS